MTAAACVVACRGQLHAPLLQALAGMLKDYGNVNLKPGVAWLTESLLRSGVPAEFKATVGFPR